MSQETGPRVELDNGRIRSNHNALNGGQYGDEHGRRLSSAPHSNRTRGGRSFGGGLLDGVGQSVLAVQNSHGVLFARFLEELDGTTEVPEPSLGGTVLGAQGQII